VSGYIKIKGGTGTGGTPPSKVLSEHYSAIYGPHRTDLRQLVPFPLSLLRAYPLIRQSIDDTERKTGNYLGRTYRDTKPPFGETPLCRIAATVNYSGINCLGSATGLIGVIIAHHHIGASIIGGPYRQKHRNRAIGRRAPSWGYLRDRMSMETAREGL
jgi:hypothetical protein